jgi:TonB-dependent starch-binding outer membrane protein SusC
MNTDGTTPNTTLLGAGPTPQIPTDPFYISNGRQVYQLNKKGTDWYKAVYHNAPTQQYYLNVSNGTDKGSALIGASYYNQDGIIRDTYYDRLTLRINTDHKFANWFKVGENASIAYSKQVQTATQQTQDGIPLDVIRQNPLLPVRDVEGNYAGKTDLLPDVRNMVSVLDKNKNNTSTSWRVFGNAFVEADILNALHILPESHSLKFKSSIGVDYSNFFDRTFNAKFQEGDYDIQKNSLTNNFGAGVTTTWTNTLEYNYVSDKHRLKVLGGTENVKYTSSTLGATNFDYPIEDPTFTYLSAGGTVTQPIAIGTATGYGLRSNFGRVDYSFSDKYLLSGTLRYDQTSRFNNSGMFPAASVGWVLTEENFMKSLLGDKGSEFLTSVKLRASYGRQGNQLTQNTNYPTTTIFGADINHTNYDLSGSNMSALQGYRVFSQGNPNLKWETTTQYDFGADVGLLDNKVQVNFDYYVKKTNDILMPAPQISALGEGDARNINGASVNNRGIDLNITYNYVNPNTDFKFATQFQLTRFRNEVVGFAPGIGSIGNQGERYIPTPNSESRNVIGKPIGEFYGYEVEGVFKDQADVDAHAAQTGKGIGRLKYKDVNGDGNIDDKDRTYLGSPFPNFSLGLNLNASYKNISLSLFFYSSVGQKVYNEVKWYTDFAQSGNFNHGTRILNAFSSEHPNSSIPAPVLGDNNNENRVSSYFVEDASFLKLRSVRLGYEIPKSYLKNLRINIYGEVQNVFRVTNYTGLDPEVPYAGGSNNYPGVDRGVYPLPRIYMIGINIKN